MTLVAGDLSPRPVAAGFDAARISRVAAKMARDYVDPGRVAGMQIAVARRGHVACFDSLGYADLERRHQVADDTIFRIYSMTKPIAAVAFLTLFEQGYFQLEDPVGKFVPSWRGQQVWIGDEDGLALTEPARRPTQMIDLLRHTAGISYGEGSHPVDDLYRARGIRDLGNPDSSHDFLDKLGSQPLLCQPGQFWSYSLASDVIGALIEHFTGERLGDYLQRILFAPLGMTSTSFAVKAGSEHRLAANYRHGADKTLELIDDPQASSFADPSFFQSGGGGLLSTTADYLRFCEMLRRGGALNGARVLGPRTVAMMMRNHLPQGRDLSAMSRPQGMFDGPQGEGMGHGLGWAVRMRDLSRGWQGNGEVLWGGAASTYFWYDPLEDMTVIVMAQLMPSHALNFVGEIRNMVYAALCD